MITDVVQLVRSQSKGRPPAQIALGRRWVWLVLLAWSACSSPAGEPALRADPTYLIDTWETEDGLPGNSATSIAQTPDGYLWFGTFNGLVRFNGVRFDVFTPANTPALPTEGIVKVYCDRHGRLWVSTYQGLAVLESGQWRQVTKDDGRAGDYARSISDRANGDLLITGFKGKVFEYSRGQLTELPPPPGDRANGYFGWSDEEGHWWVVQNRFIGKWDGGQWVKMVAPPEVDAGAVSCGPARDGGLWLVLGTELRKLRRGAEVARLRLPELPGGIWNVSEDSRGHIWIATHNRGVCRVAPNGAMLRWSATNGWSDHSSCVFEDRESNLWVGTSGAGLMRLKPQRFVRFGLESGLKESLVRSIWPGPDGLWVGTYGQGVFRITDGRVTNVSATSTGIPSPYVQSILVDRAGRTWIGTMEKALWSIDQHGVPRQIPKEQCGGPSPLALFEDSRARIWVSGSESIAVFDGTAWHGFGADQGLPFGGVVCFTEDARGAIWVSNGSGVFRQEKDRFVELRADQGQPLRGIICLKADSDGSIWLGSREQALQRWQNGRVKGLDPAAEFPSKSIFAILEDEQGYFWMTTERGIVRTRRGELQALMDGRTARMRSQIFDVSDGLPRAEFASGGQPLCARDAQGRLWFATSKGVTRIDPAALQLNETPPAVHVEEISFFQRPAQGTKQRTISPNSSEVETLFRGPFSRPVSLPAGSRRIAIHYSGLSFAAPEKVQFQVKLEGEDLDWVDAGKLRSAYYHDLPPKDYLFRVRAANNDNVWNETGTTLAFSVRPFYWQTLWFKLLLYAGIAAGGLAIVWATIRGKLHDIRERERAQEALKQSEERYREVVESQVDFVCRFLPDMTLTFVNEAYCRFVGQTRDALIGRSFLDLLPEIARGPAVNHVRSLLANPRTTTSEHEVVLPDGNIGWQYWTYHAITGSKAQVTEFQAIGRDISDRKRAEAEVQRGRAELAHAARVSTMGVLAGSLAHELNQPLTAILSNAQAGSRFLANPTPDVAEVREVLQDIAQDTKRATEVIRQLRKLVKKDDLQFERVDLNHLIHDVVRLLHSDAVIRKVQLRLECQTQLPGVRGDGVQLQQVLLNLLLNAFDAMKEVPENERMVSVRTRLVKDTAVQIEVSDRGIGIRPEKMARIFEPFQTTKIEGLGLGLSISRSIVEAHQGRLWVENNPTRGVTFSFSIPVDPGRP